MSWNNGGDNFGPSSSQMGGGFADNSSGFSSQTQSGGKRDFSKQTLHPCTIKQLTSIEAPADGGNVSLDGRELSQVRICGCIRSVQPQSTFTAYEIDDGTGMMNVKNWATPEEAPTLQENTYAMICGRLSFYEGRCSVTAFSIRPVTDSNELTYHLLETCYAHKQNTSGAKAAPSFQAQSNFGGGGTQNNFGAQNTGFGGGNTGFGGGNNNGGGFGGGNSGFGGGQFDDQMTPLQGQILQIATQYDGGEEGIHIDRIIQSVGSGANVNDIREAVEWLTNEGQLYSTIDDEHFKSTSE